MCCIENGYMALVIELQPVLSLPLTQHNALAAILLAIRVAFSGRLVLFFWNKIFHGDMDLFSESRVHLLEEMEKKTGSAAYQGSYLG